MDKVARTERGWIGHYILANQCLFRRNTLLTYAETRIVISTVGTRFTDNKFEKIGIDHYYETMAFGAYDNGYWDADVSHYITLSSPHRLSELDDNAANDMHEACVTEIEQRLLAGEKFTWEEKEE